MKPGGVIVALVFLAAGAPVPGALDFRTPTSDFLVLARAEEPIPAGLSHVQNIRTWSKPDYARVVIDLSGESRFEVHELAADPASSKPPRVYVDLQPARLIPGFKETTSLADTLVSQVRVSQFDDRRVRIVLDLVERVRAEVFALPDPFRIVIDVRNGASKPEKQVPGAGASTEPPPPSPLGKPEKASGLTVRRVIIDAGHGGKDPGAIGHKGLKEKNVALSLARRLESSIEKQLKIDAVLTRSSDEFLSLEERTAKAEVLKGDLFVSIHLNANLKRAVSGIATYSWDFTKDEEDRRLAARENQISEEKLDDLEIILRDLLRTEWINEAALLGPMVQKSIMRSVRKHGSDLKDLGAKRAPFFVLTAKMPSILIEASFITNPREAKLLRSDDYLDSIARGITEGIRQYMQVVRHDSVE